MLKDNAIEEGNKEEDEEDYKGIEDNIDSAKSKVERKSERELSPQEVEELI